MFDRASLNTPKQIIVMGVSGCGKSSIGTLLSKELGLPFVDGDDLHPQSNKDKMAAGTPLTDEDRWPWLDLVGLSLQMPGGTIIACSALKQAYRDRILAAAPNTVFVHLVGSRELLLERLGNRKGHFMPASLLESQLNTLEPLSAGEPGFEISVGGTEQEILVRAVQKLTEFEAARSLQR